MNKTKLFLYISLSTSLILSAMEAESVDYEYCEITPEIIIEYQQTFHQFKKNKEWEALGLKLCPDFLLRGRLRSMGLQDVTTKEVRTFMYRALEKASEDKLHAALARLTDEPHLLFLQNVFVLLNQQSKKNRTALSKIMRKKENRHPYLPNPDDMARISDDKFFPFAACQLFAMHLLESHGPARIKIKRDKLWPHR